MAKRIWLAVLFALFLSGLPLLYAETIHWQVDKPVGGQRLGYVVEVTQNDTPLSVTGSFTPSGKQVVQGGSSTDTPLYIRPLTSATDTVHVDSPILATVSGSVTTSGTATVSGTVTAAQAILGALKTAATLYTTDGQIMNSTHPIYVLLNDVTVSDTVYDVTMSDTVSAFNTGALPAKTVAYELRTLGGTAFKWAFSAAGINSNYYYQPAGEPLISFQLGSEKLFTGTIYFKGTTVADVMCVHIITKP
jgi:hypothetical protein